MVIEAEHSASIIIRLISCAECRGCGCPVDTSASAEAPTESTGETATPYIILISAWFSPLYRRSDIYFIFGKGR